MTIQWTLLSSTFLCYCLLCCARSFNFNLSLLMKTFVWIFKWKLLSRTFLWCCLLYCTRWFERNLRLWTIQMKTLLSSTFKWYCSSWKITHQNRTAVSVSGSIKLSYKLRRYFKPSMDLLQLAVTWYMLEGKLPTGTSKTKKIQIYLHEVALFWMSQWAACPPACTMWPLAAKGPFTAPPPPFTLKTAHHKVITVSYI